MTVMETSRLIGFLEDLSQEDWVATLQELAPSMHEVDREATRVWFGFWPLDLKVALSEAEDREEVARLMDLEGTWKLEEQIDSSVSFLYGAHYWPSVKRAVLESDLVDGSLAATIRDTAARAAGRVGVSTDLVLGITAVGFMMLRQVGQEALERVADAPATGPLLRQGPERILAERRRESRDGLFTFLRGIDRRWDVRWDEARRKVLRARNNQDIATAGADSTEDFRDLDYRRIDGPVPVECRVGSCGYCWVGVLAGREKLGPISAFERERLKYFGYDAVNGDDEKPPIRLSCQTTVHGDVTVAVPPWNGELSRRHDEGRKKMGLA